MTDRDLIRSSIGRMPAAETREQGDDRLDVFNYELMRPATVQRKTEDRE